MNKKTNNDMPWWVYVIAISIGVMCLFAELFDGYSSKPSWEVEYNNLQMEKREKEAQMEILQKKYELLENNKTW